MSKSIPETASSAPRRKRRSMAEWLEQRSWKQYFLREFREGWQGMLVSLAVHIAVLFLLGLFVYQIREDHPLLITMGWSTTVEKAEAEPEEPLQPISIPTLSLNSGTPQPTPSVPNPQPAATESVPRPAVAPVNVSTALSGRPKRSAGAPPVGGEPTLREAMDRGLQWLVKQQQPSGAWSLQGPYADGGSIETQTGATALALLALLGDGHTHRDGPYAAAVGKGLIWLQQQQRPNGDLFDVLEEGKEPHFYAHAQGTIVLCEALTLTGDEGLRPAAQHAVEFLVRAQNPRLGGWKYRPLTEAGIGDLSVTGWALMALHSARMAGIEPSGEAFILADQFLNSVQENQLNGGIYKYRPDFPPEESQRHSMTAEGLLCRQWLGWPQDHFEMRRGVEFLLQTKNRPEWIADRRNVYAWYYTAQTLHNLGGNSWEQWYAPVQQMILKNQQSAGPLRGSWHPFRPAGAFQERSRDGGRLYVTVMCLLILETPQRHQPLYKQ